MLLDVHVPIAIAEALRRHGIDVVTAQDADAALLEDEVLLQRAFDLGRVLATQDADFLEIVSRWTREGRQSRGVVFARQGIRVGAFLEELELCLHGLADEELSNQVIFLPLR